MVMKLNLQMCQPSGGEMTSAETEARNLSRRWQDGPSLKQRGSPHTPRQCCCSVFQSCPTLCDPMNSACQASLFFTISWSLLKLTSTESMMPSNYLILCRPLLLLPSIFPSIRVFQMSQLFTSVGQSIGVSASTSVLPMNTQD